MGNKGKPEVKFFAVPRVYGDTSLGTALAKVRLGGANGSVFVPDFADTVLGFWAHISPTTITTVEEITATGYLESSDGQSIKPFEFVFPAICAPLGATARSNATRGEFYVMNAAVRPGSQIIAYAQCVSGGGAMTAAAYVSLTFLFSNSRAAGRWLPTKYDERPGQQRYRKNGTLTAIQSSAAGYIDAAAIQINTGAGGGVISELLGLETQATPATTQSGGGNMRFSSNEVPAMPADFAVNALGGILGATGEQDARDTITRRVANMPCESVVNIVPSFLQGHAGTITTGDFLANVEFVRA